MGAAWLPYSVRYPPCIVSFSGASSWLLQRSRSVVKAAASGVKLGPSSQPADCCQQCRAHPECAFWNFFPLSGRCYLYTQHLCNSTAGTAFLPGQKNSL